MYTYYVYGSNHHGEMISTNFHDEESAKEFIKEMEEQGYSMEVVAVEAIVCVCCGEMIEDEKEMTLTNDGMVCENCYDQHYGACYSCDELFHVNDLWYAEGDGQYICQECYHEYYTTCAHCDEIFNRDDVFYVDGVGSVCDWCFEQRYTVCDSCGEVCRQSEARITNSGVYCCDCRPEGIMPYGYEHDLIFHQLPYEEKPLFLGVELEIDEGGHSDNNAMEILSVANDYSEQHIVIKNDGSIQYGFEIVSQPSSYEYHMSSFPWLSILETAKDLGYDTHEKCGLHIHIDRKYFGQTEEEQEENIQKLLLLVELFSAQMKVFSRRGSNVYCYYYTDCFKPQNVKDLYKEAKYRNECDRYYSVNLQNDHTVELRIFKATLDYNTFAATLQFVKFITDYAISQELDRIENNLTWENVISAISPMKYGHLVEYLKRRALWFEHSA